MKNIHLYIFAILSILLFNACQKDKDATPEPQGTGSLEIKFEHFVGNSRLRLGQSYTNPVTQEEFTPDMLRYILSNFVLIRHDGSEYVVPQDKSYFIINLEENQSLNKIQIDDIPAGKYTGLRFIIGVDSLMSTKPTEQRPSVLDPGGDAQGMYWNWNTGYIFVKFEGTSPQSTANNNRFRYHIGGFGGYDSPTINCIRELSISFGQEVNISQSHKRSAHMIVDILKLFNGMNNGNQILRIGERPTVMFNPFAVHIADNYKHMFIFDHVH